MKYKIIYMIFFLFVVSIGVVYGKEQEKRLHVNKKAFFITVSFLGLLSIFYNFMRANPKKDKAH